VDERIPTSADLESEEDEEEKVDVESLIEKMKFDQCMVKEKGLTYLAMLTVLLSIGNTIVMISIFNAKELNKPVYISLKVLQIILFIIVQIYRRRNLP